MESASPSRLSLAVSNHWDGSDPAAPARVSFLRGLELAGPQWAAQSLSPSGEGGAEPRAPGQPGLFPTVPENHSPSAAGSSLLFPFA